MAQRVFNIVYQTHSLFQSLVSFTSVYEQSIFDARLLDRLLQVLLAQLAYYFTHDTTFKDAMRIRRPPLKSSGISSLSSRRLWENSN